MDRATAMNKMIDIFAKYVDDTNGAVAIEYSLIASAMAIGIIGGFPLMSNAVKNKITVIAGYFSSL
jgi:Flp pilus assembly pilin Flp